MHIHILGICGTFMGGLALLAKQQGHTVTGSDANVYPPMSDQLTEQGIRLFEGYDVKDLQPRPDKIIVGNALKRGMPIVEYLLNENLPYISGPAWLAENILPYRWVLAVSGTHGKTTTTSLLAWMLEVAGKNPSFLLGGVSENFGVSARLTDSPFFVIEADEYDSAFFDKRSKFIHYRPRTLIINNLEFDHADIFANLHDIQKQFQHLVRIIPSEGLIITPSQTETIDAVLEQGCWSEVIQFSDTVASDWQAKALVPDHSHFEIYAQDKKQGEVAWNLIGQHNQHNALAALLAAQHAGVSVYEATKACATFKNVKRRLEIRGIINGITVYDDFAHHPTAISTTLQGLRHKVGKDRIIAVLELGSYTMRTGVHKNRLPDSLRTADTIIFLRPQHDWGIDEVCAELKERGTIFDSVEHIIDHLLEITNGPDHILMMSNSGFGGIHQKLLTALAEHKLPSPACGRGAGGEGASVYPIPT